MQWGDEPVGLVLTRNEIWLLLHALTAGPRPAVGWDGSPLEPWVAGELRLRLQSALNPEPLGAVDQRPIIDLDSDMGRTLATAGVLPLVTDDGFDLGAIVAACADRGWGAQISIPLGSTPVTPADAVVTSRTPSGETAAHTGLERPVVALARAFIAAWMESNQHGVPARPDVGPDQYVIYLDSVGPGDKPETIERMKRQGWELILDETGQPDARLIFQKVDE
ncbi:MAG: hypothetical protein KC438_10825 [Thermomicrobiales bacterium]|nr:hypothetical protein [Thermomicrobiales bacterium]MCO5223478.1 hypothetical protein [Thermomicrobiales bacterium]